ncbi:MAG: hypothetical protein COA79_25770 [Planctomycetota bacterium]|nr:MAG: hypothetical protein COA79_25770 [Planctomycetota bacterium]
MKKTKAILFLSFILLAITAIPSLLADKGNKNLTGEIIEVSQYIALKGDIKAYKKDCMSEYKKNCNKNSTFGLLIKDIKNGNNKIYFINSLWKTDNVQLRDNLGKKVNVTGVISSLNGLEVINISKLKSQL